MFSLSLSHSLSRHKLPSHYPQEHTILFYTPDTHCSLSLLDIQCSSSPPSHTAPSLSSTHILHLFTHSLCFSLTHSHTRIQTEFSSAHTWWPFNASIISNSISCIWSNGIHTKNCRWNHCEFHTSLTLDYLSSSEPPYSSAALSEYL